MAKTQSSETPVKYPILKPIIYHGPGPLNNARVIPNLPELDPISLPFPHLEPAEIKLLQIKGVIGQPS
jgi:hypothetical protein